MHTLDCVIILAEQWAATPVISLLPLSLRQFCSGLLSLGNRNSRAQSMLVHNLGIVVLLDIELISRIESCQGGFLHTYAGFELGAHL